MHPKESLAREEHIGVVYIMKRKDYDGEYMYMYIGKTVWQPTEHKNVRI